MVSREKQKGREVTLQEALRAGLLRVEVRGVGEGVTSAVKLSVTKLTDEPLSIHIPRGTEFAPVERPASVRKREEGER